MRLYTDGCVVDSSTGLMGPCTIEDKILKKKTVMNSILYTPTVVPDVLKDCLLILANDKQGHNGFKRTYSSLKQLYHWKGMKKTIKDTVTHAAHVQSTT